MVTIIGSLLAKFITPRAWCSICPMGTMQTLSYKLGKLLAINRATDEKLTIASTDLCLNYGKCSKVCPMQLIPHTDFSDKNQFDNEACIRCSTCVENCPVKILSINNEEDAIKIKNAISKKVVQTNKSCQADPNNKSD